jgi:hypothetical protein
MHPEGRERFLDSYLQALRQRLRWWQRWHFFAYDLKVTAKRRFGRKAWKRLFSGAY